jgi:hypothetical protein
MSTTTRTWTTSVAGLGIALALAVLPATGPATAGDGVKTQVARADSSVTKAVRLIQAQHYRAARKALDTADRHIRKANVQAAALIGKPPTDPEGDDPPGPPAVSAALKLDNRLSIRVSALLDGVSRPRLVGALTSTVRVAQKRRVDVLDGVLALPAEGNGADYADGLADTLPIYAREVSALSEALDTFELTADARSALTRALERARTAEARMNAAFGGGERPTA